MNTAAAAFDTRHAAKQRFREMLFRGATLAAALLVLMLLGGVVLSLLHGLLAGVLAFRVLRS